MVTNFHSALSASAGTSNLLLPPLLFLRCSHLLLPLEISRSSVFSRQIFAAAVKPQLQRLEPCDRSLHLCLGRGKLCLRRRYRVLSCLQRAAVLRNCHGLQRLP